MQLMMENDCYKIYQDEAHMFIESKDDSFVEKVILDDKFLLSNVADIAQGCSNNKYYSYLFREIIQEIISNRL